MIIAARIRPRYRRIWYALTIDGTVTSSGGRASETESGMVKGGYEDWRKRVEKLNFIVCRRYEPLEVQSKKRTFVPAPIFQRGIINHWIYIKFHASSTRDALISTHFKDTRWWHRGAVGVEKQEVQDAFIQLHWFEGSRCTLDGCTEDCAASSNLRVKQYQMGYLPTLSQVSPVAKALY